MRFIMKKRVLVFPCGTEIGLEIHNALKFSKDIELFGASSVDDHGKLVFKNYINGIPFIDDPSFLDSINKVIKDNKIDIIFPAHDNVVLGLAKLEKELACEMVNSPYETCDVCRSKSKTYKLFPEISPKLYNNSKDVSQFPVFLKPDAGEGSRGIAKANNMEELIFHVNENKELIILELLPGKEYTVDCFTDKNGDLLFTGMRERIRIRNGISVNSKTRPSTDEVVLAMANKINGKLKFRGVWFFQVKLDINNEFKLLEIAPRIAGTMCLYRNDGVNFELLSVYDRLGYNVEVNNNKLSAEVDRALINRFLVDINYGTVYVDFDDTIIINERVNETLMAFLYQCTNNNKKIILITKHVNDVRETLLKYKISQDMFDKIITLDKAAKKADHMMDDGGSIFIDDSFSERKNIHTRFGIPCFDLDMVESLIDWKR